MTKKVVPFGLKREPFLVRYRRELDRASDATIDRLRHLFQDPVPPEVRAADAEVFLDEDGVEGLAVWNVLVEGRGLVVRRSDRPRRARWIRRCQAGALTEPRA
jgi:hypothetical protein